LARVLIGGRERDAPRRRDDPRTPSSISTSLFDPSTSSRYLDSSLMISQDWLDRNVVLQVRTATGRTFTLPPLDDLRMRACVVISQTPRPIPGPGRGRSRSLSFISSVRYLSLSLSLLSLALSVVWIEKDACYPSVMLDSCSLSSWSSCLFRETHCPSRDSVISAHRSWRVVAMRD
jgi:hypothetical protein